MRYFFILLMCGILANSHAQDSTKLYFPPKSFLKNAFIWEYEIYNSKMHSIAISMHANTDSVFINYNCKVNKIIEWEGFGLIEFDIGDGYMICLGQFESWTVNKNEILERGRFVGIAEPHETKKGLFSLFILASKDGKFLSIDEHLDYFKLNQ
jgi:hypothetical protein